MMLRLRERERIVAPDYAMPRHKTMTEETPRLGGRGGLRAVWRAGSAAFTRRSRLL
ncbi:hypothetical protein BRAO375_2340013 [Bradyrhizobium sp. ORS 375]|nr:hypothetical protein BRAO375_2340013 [Bradyrhizobium sp. ORS 375]